MCLSLFGCLSTKVCFFIFYFLFLFFFIFFFLFLFFSFPYPLSLLPHTGKISNPTGPNSTKTCHYYNNIQDTLSVYRIFYYTTINNKCYSPVKVVSIGVGSEVGKKYGALPLEGGDTSLLSPEVQVFILLFYYFIF